MTMRLAPGSRAGFSGVATSHGGAQYRYDEWCRAHREYRRRAVRARIGVAGLVADRDDHTGAARDFGGGFLSAAFEAAIETKPFPGFRKLVSAPTIWHSVFPRLSSDRRLDDL